MKKLLLILLSISIILNWLFIFEKIKPETVREIINVDLQEKQLQYNASQNQNETIEEWITNMMDSTKNFLDF